MCSTSGSSYRRCDEHDRHRCMCGPEKRVCAKRNGARVSMALAHGRPDAATPARSGARRHDPRAIGPPTGYATLVAAHHAALSRRHVRILRSVHDRYVVPRLVKAGMLADVAFGMFAGPALFVASTSRVFSSAPLPLAAWLTSTGGGRSLPIPCCGTAPRRCYGLPEQWSRCLPLAVDRRHWHRR
jgi:hypothetical protein